MGEKLSQMVFKKCVGIQCGGTADGRVSVTLLEPLWLLMLTWWCTRCKGRTVFCETSTPWFFCLFRHSKWKDALRPEKQSHTTVSITHNTLEVICFQFLLVQSHWRYSKDSHILGSVHFPSTPCPFFQKAIKHHWPTSTSFQASCKIKFCMMIFIFPLLKKLS